MSNSKRLYAEVEYKNHRSDKYIFLCNNCGKPETSRSCVNKHYSYKNHRSDKYIFICSNCGKPETLCSCINSHIRYYIRY